MLRRRLGRSRVGLPARTADRIRRSFVVLVSGCARAPSFASVGGLGGVAPADAGLAVGRVPAERRRGGRRRARGLGASEVSLLLHPRWRPNRKVRATSETGSALPQQTAPLRTGSKRTTGQPSLARRRETHSGAAPSRGLSGRPRSSSCRETRSLPLSKRSGLNEAA